MTFRKPLAVASLALLVLAAVVVVRTLLFTPKPQPHLAKAELAVDSQRIASHLSEAIAFATVSYDDPAQIDRAPFQGFLAWLATTYPKVHANLKVEAINHYGRLFTWPGSDPSLAPILLSAHYDVVPVQQSSAGLWQQPPFSGLIKDGYIWGRGALDDKSAAVALMESLSDLVNAGFSPRRTLMVALNFDEEVGSEHGAKAIAAMLKARHIEPLWSLDEGSFVLDGVVSGVALPVASINVAEKGYLTIDVTAHGQGGHSSMPPHQTAVGILAQALVRLQNAPVPGGLDGLSAEMFDNLARYMPFDKRLLFANRWLFGALLNAELSKSATTNATLRTTTAPTMLSGSVKSNVLPVTAEAVINFRLHPRDNVDSVLRYVQKTIDDDRVSIAVRDGRNASSVSDSQGPGFLALAKASREVYGDVVVTPGLTVGATDSSYYDSAVQNAYRFNPMVLKKDELGMFHGINERITVANMAAATRFYSLLMKDAASH
ncbi:M20 family peptidase [Gallaecimonas pentaromativorans]|uniref:Carboxypeptidase PM20D1 n=1 Tax=Gallaecimonas pentaromativorans TaxID=584787 RepID=A0A3N1P4C3_9GAMM|nr:M20 family peptidase [Gallaecimonas pentaromativorans]ROQ22488.1 carboxypeptidase PM20D1 [Gallaecimonas pentaromativorans]